MSTLKIENEFCREVSAFIPAIRMHETAVQAKIEDITRLVGGCSENWLRGVWFNSEGKRVEEAVAQVTWIVPTELAFNGSFEAHALALREILHTLGEEEVLITDKSCNSRSSRRF